MVSVLILTLNEEADLPDCLRSVAWCDDIIVLDSFSTDRTVEIARAAGAQVIQRKFDNWAAHQNWAMEHIPFRHPWVFYLDADERCSDAVRDEVLATTSDPTRNTLGAYYVGRRNYFMGRPLDHVASAPVMRLFQPSMIRFERLVNPVPVVTGGYGYLQSRFTHFPFSKGLIAWLNRHNEYARLEAMEAVRVRSAPLPEGLLGWAPWRDPAMRRRVLKFVSFFLEGRALLRFVHGYFVRGGILEGQAGFEYCLMMANYENWIELKIHEIEQPWQKQTDRLVAQLLREKSR